MFNSFGRGTMGFAGVGTDPNVNQQRRDDHCGQGALALRRKHEARTDAGAKRRDMRQKEKAGKMEQSRKMRQHFYQLQMEGRR